MAAPQMGEGQMGGGGRRGCPKMGPVLGQDLGVGEGTGPSTPSSPRLSEGARATPSQLPSLGLGTGMGVWGGLSGAPHGPAPGCCGYGCDCAAWCPAGPARGRSSQWPPPRLGHFAPRQLPAPGCALAASRALAPSPAQPGGCALAAAAPPPPAPCGAVLVRVPVPPALPASAQTAEGRRDICQGGTDPWGSP